MDGLIWQANADLRAYNSFAVAARAKHLVRAQRVEDLVAALQWADAQSLGVEVLGGGSNVLLVGDLDGVLLLPELRGIEWLGVQAERMHVRAAAGENWHEFVQTTLGHGAYGLENLALIPGHVGAAPIQNIGAYGVELDRFVVAVEAIDRLTRTPCRIPAADCAFAYRDSRFKQAGGARYLITAVEFALPTRPDPMLAYAGLQEELAAAGVKQARPMDVFAAVCAIRQRKLPDPKRLGNAGSFFKNPVISGELAGQLRLTHAGLPVYAAGEGQAKLAAAWLIEQCGWKGARRGDAGVHAQHALVLVNHGQASGREILDLARQIQNDVLQRFTVDLEIEPRVIGGANRS